MSSEAPEYEVMRVNLSVDEEFDETEAWERELKPLFDKLVTKCEELNIPSMLLVQWQAKIATEEELANMEVDEDTPLNSSIAINRPDNRPNEIIDANIALLKGEAVLYKPLDSPEKDEVWLNHPGNDRIH